MMVSNFKDGIVLQRYDDCSPHEKWIGLATKARSGTAARMRLTCQMVDDE